MEKLRQKEHDFSAKLRQRSVIERLRRYILWQREVRKGGTSPALPPFGPISINLDLTTACNFRCPHCVDTGIINTGEQLDADLIRKSIDVLKGKGLLSVILIGGGEPTVHRDFEEIVRHTKGLGLQVGIVTNGSRLERVERVGHLLTEGDWLRLSIDAASEDTFRKSHMPAGNVTLLKVLGDAARVKKAFPVISLGYSYVIVWEGIVYYGRELTPNLDELPHAVDLAREHSFDYVSYKPCLLRLEGSGKESLFDPPDPKREDLVIHRVQEKIDEADRSGGGSVKILKSVNLQAMTDRKLHELKNQPRVCHAQFFRTVLAPSGIFQCPALRGVALGRINENSGYGSEAEFFETHANLDASIRAFDAAKECNVVVCFYHHVNWWIERFIESSQDVSGIQEVEDNNFFI